MARLRMEARKREKVTELFSNSRKALTAAGRRPYFSLFMVEMRGSRRSAASYLALKEIYTAQPFGEAKEVPFAETTTASVAVSSSSLLRLDRLDGKHLARFHGSS